MFFRKLLQASIRANKTGHFLWIGSDSWGAKVYPVRDQEWAAEGAITILPHRTAIQGSASYIIIILISHHIPAAPCLQFFSHLERSP